MIYHDNNKNRYIKYIRNKLLDIDLDRECNQQNTKICNVSVYIENQEIRLMHVAKKKKKYTHYLYANLFINNFGKREA